MEAMAEPVGRVVALGASNLTRGFHTIVATARHRWGRDVEVLGALGHGRAYRVRSSFLMRSLPGIAQCGIWSQLERMPRTQIRGIVTDIGNDILYGASADQVLTSVDHCLARLQRFTDDVVLTDLPLSSIRALSSARFLLFRSVLVPQCRSSLAEVVVTAGLVSEGLHAMAAARRVRLLPQKPEWYGVDPIHIRPALWRPAWQEILCGETDDRPETRASWSESLRLYALRPERQWLLGREQVTPQQGVALGPGGRVWLF
jgi:hypothetical protein